MVTRKQTPKAKVESAIVPSDNIADIVQIPSLENIGVFEQFCRENPDAIPQAVEKINNQVQYIVGYWWNALEQGQKKKALEDNPQFAELYTWETCKNYSISVSKIPSVLRSAVISFIPMKTTRVISGAFDNEKDLILWFDFALQYKPSASLMTDIIREVKSAVSPHFTINLFSKTSALNLESAKKELKQIVQAASQETKELMLAHQQTMETLKSKQTEIASLTAQLQQLEKIETDNKEKSVRIAELKAKVEYLANQVEELKNSQVQYIEKEVEVEVHVANKELELELSNYKILNMQLKSYLEEYEEEVKELQDQIAQMSRQKKPSANDNIKTINITPTIDDTVEAEINDNKRKQATMLLQSTISYIQDTLYNLLENPNLSMEQKEYVRMLLNKF